MQAFLWGFIDFKVLESAKIGKTAKNRSRPNIREAKKRKPQKPLMETLAKQAGVKRLRDGAQNNSHTC